MRTLQPRAGADRAMAEPLSNDALSGFRALSISLRYAFWCAMLSVIAGCANRRPAYDMPVPPLPAQYREAGGGMPDPAAGTGSHRPAPGGRALPPSATDPNRVAWWRDFESAELDGLVDRALANNPDMRIAVQRIVQAKARADQARAGRLPSVSAPLVVADQSPGSGTVGAAPAGSGSSNSGSSSQATWQASVRADWRLDLWGEQSALAESAGFQLNHAVYERDNVERNLVAALAANYVEYLSLNDRRAIALKIDELQSATLATIEARVKAGDATVSDLEQQRAAVYSVRATLPMLEQQRMDALATIAFLAGTLPGKLRLSELGLDTLNVPVVASGLPSQLLLRRPDVRMAEAQLRTANADVEVARARLLPPMDLAAQLGRSGTSPLQLLQPQTLFWTMVETLTVAIFDGGRKKNDEVFSRSVHEEMVEGYVRAAHQAMKEVESALTTMRLSKQRLVAQKDTLDAAYRAWEISARIYKVGGVDYLTLLDTQRTYHRYLDDYAQGRMAYFRSYITLLEALGGGARQGDGAGAADAAPAGTVVGPPRPTDTTARCFVGVPRAERAGPAALWEVQLAGAYHCSTVAPAWRDLAARYPNFMVGRTLDPVLEGRLDNSPDVEQSWYRLAVGRFGTEVQATEFCAALTADQLRCRVVPLQPPKTTASAVTPKGAAAPVLPAAFNDRGPLPAGHPLSHATDAPAPEPDSLAHDLHAATLALPERLPAATAPAVSPGQRILPVAAPSGALRAANLPDTPGKGRFLQIGAFHEAPKAEALYLRAAEALTGTGETLKLFHDGSLIRVLVGPMKDARSERTAAARVRDRLGTDAHGVVY